MIYELVNRFIGLLFLAIFLPVILVIAVWIKIDSPGRAIFTQTRVGKDFKKFTFYKFRTMWEDAHRKFPELYKYNYTEDEVEHMKFKVSDDPRITNTGTYLRKISLDELPNLINVVRGEMNLVGPRPEIPEMIKYYKPEQMKKFSIKPGITGFAQTNGRGNLTFQKTIEYDLKYVDNRNVILDFYIFIKTSLVVIKSIGAF